MLFQFQKQIFGSTTLEELTVRGAQMTQPGIPLQALAQTQEQTKEDKLE